ncbi:hypothetical protein XENTR_v10002116 [Xenopus tropicalis]|nr:cathepsin G [Xenopus tropicalis]AAI57677.1 LOC100135369 protein [Xenopus tropicalis]AAI71088.1 hypothetical protein LOC100135369 [Xenopus tropicalis]AAI71092.1 hypothetical protein LOC100135369 [Xenopus tropicalis]KAE8633847.1 hypothetical protein XENTR_v10002116 [Xenopus tropicalis]|eukprot:NP_001107513.1 cathepsin G [Xenopus tropicalis]
MAFLNITTYDNNMTSTARCGGILISEEFVLTAAHCAESQASWISTKRKAYSKIVVILGAHNIDEQEQSQQKIGVCEQIKPPEYSTQRDEHDIMLLKLMKKAVPNQYVLPIRPRQSGPKLEPHNLCNVAGWGRINTFNDKMASKLQELNMTIVAPDECAKAFPRVNTKKCICAKNTDKKSSCRGDSGGPLFCNQYLHGLVNGGNEKCTGPRLFTNVFSHIEWINKILKNPKCKKES